MFKSFSRNHSVHFLFLALAFASIATMATSRTHANRLHRNAGLAAVTADVALTQRASPSAGVANGSQLTYTLTVTNSGPDPATDVNVNDPLPAGTTFVSVAPSQGSCTDPGAGNNGTVNCALGAVPATGSATISLVVTFTGAPGSSIANTATVSTTSADMNSANDSATSNTMVAKTTCSPVTNNSDSLPGSLRAAIICANGNPGLDAITFNIPGAGVHTIALLSTLPSLNGPVYLDAYSQPGSSQNTLSIGDNAILNIELNGASAGSGFVNGLTINGGGNGSTVRGLVINRFGNHGIFVNASGTRIEGNFIGTNAAAGAVLANARDGIQLNNAANNVVGGPGNGARNIISGNGAPSNPPQPANGVDLFGSSSGNIVQNNYIGTDATGALAIPNLQQGVVANGAANNAILKNLLSGNTGSGVGLFGPTASGNTVQGNFIGTTANGSAALGNQFGVNISSGSQNLIGDSTLAARNVISGNRGPGISINNGATFNLIQGNLIGTDATGTAAISNSNPGGSAININGSSNNTIGGSSSATRNIISGNRGNGAFISGGSGNNVQGNYIGTTISGSTALGNGNRGVFLSGTTNAVVSGNVLSANKVGASIESFGTGNQVQGNLIGTQADGVSALGNSQFGVLVDRSSNNTITMNTIAFNGASSSLMGGVIVSTIDPGSGTGPAAGNAIRQNSIYSNFGLGIDLVDDSLIFGVTPNDSCDTDTGGNNFQNFPVLTSVAGSGGNNTIQGTLNSAPNTIFTIDFYANATTDASGNGEGQTYLGSTTVTTGADCNGSFTATFAQVPGQPVITATATDPAGNTSEFSAWVATTSTTLTSDNNPSTYGQPVTFTATVTSSAGTPTGTVTFKEGATTLGTGTLNGSGQATFTTSSLSAGTHSITATYEGTTNYLTSTSDALAQTVNQASTTTGLTSSPNPSTYGQPVTFTATVNSSGGTPTGTVTFKDGATVLATVTLDGSGQATFTTSSLSAGTHSVTATYSGDSNFSGSTSTPVVQTVTQATTTTSLTSSANPSSYGQPVTFTATVTSSGGTPTGTVTFKDGATVLGTVTLNGSGQATFTTSSLFIGAHSITATYNGDNNFTGGTSPPLVQTVLVPASTESVKVTGGGFITLASGGDGSFGMIGMVSKQDVPSGNVEYQDHDTGMNVKSTAITAIVVSGTHARIFGKATINGSGSYDFVVDVDDLGEPGIGSDRFGIQISNGYSGGPAPLSGGNIQVH